MTQYYFDTLPIHPPPESFESFTSYLMRLAEANDLRTRSSVISTCFLGKYRSVKSFNNDNPPVSLLSSLQVAANCSESALLSTTFFHLSRKFGRSNSSPGAIRFLSGTIAPTLRYCPLCISNRPYYSLLWRFLFIPGCIYHKCHFIDSCGRCGRPIDLFAAPFKIGICPFCEEKLQRYPDVLLTEKELHDAKFHSQVLEFLLSPQPWDANVSVERIGAYFATLRQKRHLTVQEVSRQMGVRERCVETVEYGVASGAGELFENYVRYALFFCTSLQEIFEAIMVRNSPCRQKMERKSLSEEEVVRCVQESIQQLKYLDKLVTQRAISEMTGISRLRLKSFSRVKVILKQANADAQNDRRRRRASHCDEMFERVQKAIKSLEILEVPVTQRAICEIVGMTLTGLKYYPEIKELLECYMTQHSYVLQRSSLREKELVEGIEAAIENIKISNLKLTQTSISHAVGLTLGKLKKYPRAKILLEQYAASKKQKGEEPFCENDLLNNVEEVIENLEKLGHNVTISAISEKVGVTLSELRSYPRIKILLEQCSSRLYYASSERSLSKEDKIMVEVKKAILQLEVLEVPITQKAIGEIVGMPVPKLRSYSRVYTFLRQIASKDHLETYCSEKADMHEDELVVQLEEAVKLLESLGKMVTQRGVSEIMGLSATAPYHYPKLVSRLNGLVKDKKKQSNLAQRQAREDKLVVEASEAMEQLKTLKKTISIASIARAIKVPESTLRHYPNVIKMIKKFS